MVGSVVFEGHTFNLKASLEVWLDAGTPFLPVLIVVVIRIVSTVSVLCNWNETPGYAHWKMPGLPLIRQDLQWSILSAKQFWYLTPSTHSMDLRLHIQIRGSWTLISWSPSTVPNATYSETWNRINARLWKQANDRQCTAQRVILYQPEN